LAQDVADLTAGRTAVGSLFELARSLISLSTECERTHEEISNRLNSPNSTGLYYRFNVRDRRLSKIGLAEYQQLPAVTGYAYQYMESNDVQLAKSSLVRRMLELSAADQALTIPPGILRQQTPAIHNWTGSNNQDTFVPLSDMQFCYLERIDIATGYPSGVHVSNGGAIRPIGRYIFTYRRRTLLDIRFLRRNIPPGKYRVIWIMSFFDNPPENGPGDNCHRIFTSSDGIDERAPVTCDAETLTLMAGQPREDFLSRHFTLDAPADDPGR
jgi:hypothetical protein